MNNFAFAWRSLRRDLRAGELSLLLAAIVIAVGAMTAVGFFTDRVGRAVEQQASAVIAGDIVARSSAPIDSSWLDQARASDIESAESIEFPTMVIDPRADESALAFVRGISPEYPLRGEVLVSTEMFGDASKATGAPAPGAVWAEAGLLGRLGVDIGDSLVVGELTLTITRVLEYQPNQGFGGFSGMAPGIMINRSDVERLNVIKPGSRVTYRQFFAGEADAIDKFRDRLEDGLGSAANVNGVEDAGEQINAAIDRARRFLNLASLVTVILAAVATAMASRRYALRHLDTVALLKSLGATQSIIQNSTLLQLLLIIVATTIIGSVLGYAAQWGLVALAADLLKVELPPTALTAGILGVVTAATIVIGFALPHLLHLQKTAPLRVLRHDLPPPPLRAGVTYAAAIGALLAMIYFIVRDLLLVGLIAGGIAILAVVSMGAGWLLVRMLTKFRGAAGVAWRYGLASIARRGSESVVQIVAFALSLMVLLLLTLVRNDLLDEWRATVPENAPNYFLINIEPDVWPRMEAFIKREFGSEPAFLPFIRGRFLSINGRPLDDIDFPDPRGSRLASQETNLTWQRELPLSNSIRGGKWWGADYDGEIQISVESGMAQSLGLKVGDTMGIDVGGETFEAKVTSLRFVEWDSMAPNFFFMLSPGESEDLPQTYIASFFVPSEKRRMLSTFVRTYPGVTVLDLEVILGQVRMVIDRASMSVQYVFLFTLLAGIIVLLAAVQMTRDERRFESAILHTLGADRRTILQGVAVEFIALGGLAGALAALGATGIGYVLADRVFELGYTINPLHWLAGLLAGGLIVGVTGTLATRKAVNEPPVAVLRDA